MSYMHLNFIIVMSNKGYLAYKLCPISSNIHLDCLENSGKIVITAPASNLNMQKLHQYQLSK